MLVLSEMVLMNPSMRFLDTSSFLVICRLGDIALRRNMFLVMQCARYIEPASVTAT